VPHILDELPETLDETYERILRDINKANRDHAHRLLQCLTVAVRPLRVAELAEVLSVDFRTASRGDTSKLNPDWRWEDQKQAVVSTCSSLISVVDEDDSQVVQFSHFSVKEFLTSPRLATSSANLSRFHILLGPAHTIFAKACLGVLLRLDEQVDRDNVENNFPLARYAAEYWVNHAKFEQVSSHLREGMEDLFDPVKPYFAAWLRVHDIDVDSDEFPLYWFAVDSKEKLAAAPLYYAALCGFQDLAETLIVDHPEYVNANGGHYVSPLAATLGARHFKMAQLLYQRGADVNVRGLNERTLLYRALDGGHLEIAQWLLSRGADANARDAIDGCIPLHSAAENGRVDVARLLLQYKADNNSQNNEGRIPLHKAARNGHVDVALLLLEHGADANAKDNNLTTPLHLASSYGGLEVARLLLEHGADVEAEDDEGWTPSQVASGDQCDEITKLLSEHRIR
jgi:ankyrin repeat protein